MDPAQIPSLQKLKKVIHKEYSTVSDVKKRTFLIWNRVKGNGHGSDQNMLKFWSCKQLIYLRFYTLTLYFHWEGTGLSFDF